MLKSKGKKFAAFSVNPQNWLSHSCSTPDSGWAFQPSMIQSKGTPFLISCSAFAKGILCQTASSCYRESLHHILLTNRKTYICLLEYSPDLWNVKNITPPGQLRQIFIQLPALFWPDLQTYLCGVTFHGYFFFPRYKRG